MSSFGYELRTLRAKLSRLLDIYESFNSYTVPFEEWPYWMEKFNALASQYASLQKEITLALELAIVEPISANGNIDHIPGVLLRSKLPPEAEERCPMVTISADQWKSQLERLNNVIEAFTAQRESFEESLRQHPAPTFKPADLTAEVVEPALIHMYTGV